VEAETINTFKTVLINIGLIKMFFFSIFMPTLLELEVYRFVCDFILFMNHDTGKEDYLRPSELIGLD